MQIPKPFTKARFAVAKPIAIGADADDEAIERGRSNLQAALERLVREGEEWRHQNFR
jgi:lysophospholipid acyltransferase (LPLAT)-like uncharacterized protein